MRSDGFAAVGAEIGEEKCLIETLVAEGVPATDQHRSDQRLKTNGTVELLSATLSRHHSNVLLESLLILSVRSLLPRSAFFVLGLNYRTECRTRALALSIIVCMRLLTNTL